MANDAKRSTTGTFQEYYPDAHSEIVQPARYDHYLIRRWLSDLGPTGFLIVKVLRDRLYYNKQTGVMRNELQIDMDELAAAVGVSRATLFREFAKNAALGEFVRKTRQYRMVNGHPEQTKNAYEVSMGEPIHPLDQDLYERLREQKEQDRAEREASLASGKPRVRVLRDSPGAFESQNATQGRKQGNGLASQNATQGGKSRSVGSQNATPNTPSQIETGQSQFETALDQLPFGDHIPLGISTPSLAASPDNETSFPQKSPEGDDPDPLSVAWSLALGELAGKVNTPTYKTHLAPARLVAWDAESATATLRCAMPIGCEWISRRHGEAVASALARALRRETVTVKYEAGGK